MNMQDMEFQDVGHLDLAIQDTRDLEETDTLDEQAETGSSGKYYTKGITRAR